MDFSRPACSVRLPSTNARRMPLSADMLGICGDRSGTLWLATRVWHGAAANFAMSSVEPQRTPGRVRSSAISASSAALFFVANPFRLAQASCSSLTTCKSEIKTGRIGIPASARTVPARRTPEASRNDRDSRQSSIHRRHSLAVEAFALNLQCGN